LPFLADRPVGSVVWATVTMDRDGRLADTFLFRALGWDPGLYLDIRINYGLVLAFPDPGGLFRMPRPGRLRLPTAVRRRSGLVPGDRLLLTATRDVGMLTVHPPDAVTRMVADFHTPVLGGEAG
jgi:hypothetical protein